MQKILMISEEPNKKALKLDIEDLYDIEKNPFCQFFGRLLFGTEELTKKYFTINNIKWMHAKGSTFYGLKAKDGKKAILNDFSKYKLIITFGKKAIKIFLPKLKNFQSIFNGKLVYPVKWDKIKSSHNLETENELDCEFYFFPHPSGQAQPAWMKFAVNLSKNLDKMQKNVLELVQ
ncbi:MAG: hypothetical protein JW969_17020 [Spirochaetales bacterium]|nr:hypothetical protein [Spirochaetales bacterium]